MDYVILLATDPSSLATQVNNLLNAGWQCQGGVMLSQTYDKDDPQGYSDQWAQAMTKQEVSH